MERTAEIQPSWLAMPVAKRVAQALVVETAKEVQGCRKPLPSVSSAESLFVLSGESAVTPMTWFAATCGFGGASLAGSASIRTCFSWKCWIFY
jgi:hypothetical protein